jgi:hypothetical protein
MPKRYPTFAFRCFIGEAKPAAADGYQSAARPIPGFGIRPLEGVGMLTGWMRPWGRRVCAALFMTLLAPLAWPQEHEPGNVGPQIDLDRRQDLVTTPLSPTVVAERMARQHAGAANRGDRHSPGPILFGDLHVHTTYSVDAFSRALPLILGADGTRPPTDACNYARYVSQLDFFAITDHAEEITPDNWRKTLDALRLCALVGGAGVVPDVIPFAGFEWSQVGGTAESHWGHHNVIFKTLAPEDVPARPIRAPASDNEDIGQVSNAVIDKDSPASRSMYEAFNRFARELAGVARCPPNSPKNRSDCQEVASTPKALLETLKAWGFEHIVIPHGSAWGLYTPPGSSWEHQLNRSDYDPATMKLIEIYSAHGTSEVYKPFREVGAATEGAPSCVPPTTIYLPECWQAGEIIRRRCQAKGLDAHECDDRAAAARRDFLAMPGITGWTVVPDSTPEEWLDAGQARGIYMPAFNYRPRKSAQYGLALTNFDDPAHPLRFKWGFIGSTDTHSARPGHGFKSVDRTENVDLWDAVKSPDLLKTFLTTQAPAGTDESKARDPSSIDLKTYGFDGPYEMERLGSFLSLGGLVAVHARERSREGIWDALQAKDVYGTTGVRILLWFDLLNASEGSGKPHEASMGSEVSLRTPPRFRVYAVGSEKQKPGCPEFVKKAMTDAQLSHLAGNECYYPSRDRYAISRIEVVRIRPQKVPGENVDRLIEDPWKTYPCEPKSPTCRVEFTDDEFSRDSVYYVRAIEEPTPVINGKNLRTKFDENGNPVAVTLCYMDTRTNPKDDCLSEVEQRAWSSPIYVDRRH